MPGACDRRATPRGGMLRRPIRERTYEMEYLVGLEVNRGIPILPLDHRIRKRIGNRGFQGWLRDDDFMAAELWVPLFDRQCLPTVDLGSCGEAVDVLHREDRKS